MALDALMKALSDVEAKQEALADIRACRASDRSFALHLLADIARRAGSLVRYTRGFGVVTSALLYRHPDVVIALPREPTGALFSENEAPMALSVRKEIFQAIPSKDRTRFYYRVEPCKPGCGERFGTGALRTRTWQAFIPKGASHLDFCSKECCAEYEFMMGQP